MATKIYTSGGAVFEVKDDYATILAKLQQAQTPPFVFESQIEDEDRRLVVVNQYIVAVEESY